MNKKLARLLAPPFLAVFLAHSLAADVEQSGAGAEYSAENYMLHLKYLTDDKLEGRLPGTPGGLGTTEYIAEQFKAIGLKPAGVDGTYFQPFTIRRLKKRHDENAAFLVNGAAREWVVGEDWTPMPFTKPGKIAGPLAFAGYGISASKYDYDDYADFDAEGKVLLIMRHEPRSDDPDAAFGGETPSRHSLFSKKATVAAEHGAKGLLIVNPPVEDDDADKLYPWHDWDTNQSYSLPIVHISREIAGELLKEAGLPDLHTLLEQLDTKRKSISTGMKGVEVKIKTGVKYVKGRNVVGLLEGTDSDEIIVLGAHHDHLGKVPVRTGESPRPQIHNGADDNASGSSAILEFARVLSAGPRPRRGILFITFDGEELGLLGSRHFADNPTVKIEKIRAMLNFDMIGRMSNDNFTLFGAGSGKEFRGLLENSSQAQDITYRDPRTDSRGASGSDAFSFYIKDIPTMFAFTGIHKLYHMPGDDWELIDDEGAVKILQFLHPVILALADMTEGPEFVAADDEPESPHHLWEVAPPTNAAPTDDEKPTTAVPKAQRGAVLSVSMRVIPDMAYDQGDGLHVMSPIKGGPAQQAGMKDDDLIVRIGDERITDIYSYMEALKTYEPNDVADVVVQRDGKEVALKVTLGKAQKRRPSGDQD